MKPGSGTDLCRVPHTALHISIHTADQSGQRFCVKITRDRRRLSKRDGILLHKARSPRLVSSLLWVAPIGREAVPVEFHRDMAAVGRYCDTAAGGGGRAAILNGEKRPRRRQPP